MSPSRWFDQLNGIAPILIDAALRGAIVLLLALALTYALRRRSAAARHLVWIGAIVVQLLLPLFAIWGPRWDVAISNRVASVLPVSLPSSRASVPPTSEIRDGGPTGGVSAPTVEGAPSGGRRATTADATVDRAAGQEITSDRAPVSGRAVLLALWILGALETRRRHLDGGDAGAQGRPCRRWKLVVARAKAE